MSEEKEIKRLGAKAQRNSGRGSHQKSDARKGPFTIDIKEYNESYSVSRKGWAKLSLDAAKNGNDEPALFLCLGKKGEYTIRLAVVEEAMFNQMLDAWEQIYGEG